MSGDTGGVAGSVRRQLAEGRAPEDIVEELVAGGLSKPSAQRFVDRALSMPASQAPPAAALETTRSFPKGAIVLAIIAAAGIAIAVVVMRSRPDPEAEALAAADLEQAERIRQEGATSLGSAEPDYRRYELAEKQLTSSNSPMLQCNAALTLGKSKSEDFVPPLVELSRKSPHASVRSCAAGALAEIGATQDALNVYYHFSQSLDTEEQRLAITGFGDLGPAGAEHSLPYLERALQSESWEIRFLTVDSLAKIGPLAAPLLEEATQDPHKEVSNLAKNGLARLKR